MIKSEHLISVRSRSTLHVNGICVSKNISLDSERVVIVQSRHKHSQENQFSINPEHCTQYDIHASGHRSHFMFLTPPPSPKLKPI